MVGVALSSILREPRSRASAGVYEVEVIPGFPLHYVGRDDQGRACVLLGSVDSDSRAPVRLSGLSVQYALTCAVRVSNCEDIRRVLTVVTCTGAGPDAERYFLHILASVVDILGTKPSLRQVAEAITQLAAIFQRLTLPSRESVVGIVGELILIASAASHVAAIAAWRIDPDERYDFVLGKLRLEVKSSTTRRRIHGFSFEQCDVPTECQGVVASVIVEKSAGGLSLEGLIGVICEAVASFPQTVFKVQQTLADTLGAGLPEALGFRFDYNLAISEIKFYDLEKIPAVRTPLDPLVSQIRFMSDLSASFPLSRDYENKYLSDFVKRNSSASP